MSKRKLEKFAAINTFLNVLQNTSYQQPQLFDFNGNEASLKEKWNHLQFQNNNPNDVELACGKGEYTVAMAKSEPYKNFIGVDRKGNRIDSGAKTALNEHMHNVAFLRTNIELLPAFFSEAEISGIWIPFPDPHVRRDDKDKRLTSENFLRVYSQILKPGGEIHLKTDDELLYKFTLQTISRLNCKLLYADDDIYSKPLIHPFLEIKTHYEKMHLAERKKIKYVQFSLPDKFQ